MEIPEAIRCLHRNNPLDGSDFAEACDLAMIALWTIKDGVVPKEFHDRAMEIQYERLRAPQRWIPVSERLPEVGMVVIGYDVLWSEVCPVLLKQENKWHKLRSGKDFELERLSHWQPLTEPPGGE